MLEKKGSRGGLKIFRVLVAVPVLGLLLLLFLDFTHSFPTVMYRGGEFFQFLPSLLKFINTFSVAALGWLVVLALTVFFGRVYCSLLCPLGISFDAMRRLAPKKIQSLPSFRQGGFLRYGILVVFLASIAGGYMISINLLDPFSNFGRLVTDLVRPLVIGANNGTVHLLEAADVYTLPPHDLRGYSLPAIGYGIIYLGGIVFLSLRRGRLYCNTLCPVGTVLGFFSYFSFFKVRIDEKTCTACGACARVCKASCIEHKTKLVDPARCVACMNCLDVCPEDAIAYRSCLTSQGAGSREENSEE